MSSLIARYNYDIFISYRQKDNKYDGWVTEFVDNLRKELEATFKEEISVYFDNNPHDGLLETHDVNESLKEKLKCLVFIPIFSRTYCDPKSFAWEHEFRAFIGEASKDRFGLKVKLPNGNVANRVLPVKIHDLDAEDVQLCESVLGGVLRGVEFIYKEAGVNRSLTPKDDERKNLNATIYRNQINKVALAIKEIILGMQTVPAPVVEEKNQNIEQTEKIINEGKRTVPGKRKILIAASIVAILFIAGILAWPKIFKRDTRIPITVVPFKNNSNDTTLDVLQIGIQLRLATSLSNSANLKVKQTELVTSYLQSKGLTSNASLTPSLAKIISKKLDVSVLVSGGIFQDGSVLKLIAELRNSKTGEVIKSFEINGELDEILHTSDSLSKMIMNYLLISKHGKTESPVILASWPPYTSSPDAYKYHLLGSEYYVKGNMQDAIYWFLESLKVDSNFYMPAYQLSATYFGRNQYDLSKDWVKKLYKKRDQLRPIDQLRVNFMHAKCYETDFEAIKYLTRITELDENSVVDLWLLGSNYSYTSQNKKAIEVLEKVLKICDEWDSKPYSGNYYALLLKLYHGEGQHKKEKRLYKRAEQDFPVLAGNIFYLQAVHSFAEKDITEANRYIDKYVSFLSNRSMTETNINLNLAYLYTEAGYLDKVESTYLRRNLFLEPDSPRWQNLLAYFLIDKERNIDEGLQILDNLLKIYPDNYTYLGNKGYGLYKKGKYKEALELMQKSWVIRREKAVYDYDAFQRLEAAKKAVADLK